MLKQMSYLLVCLFVVGLCAADSMAAGATGSLAEDDFNDNVQNRAIWPDVHTEENGVITETNHQLEYTSSDAPSDENVAQYNLDRDLAYDGTWTVTVDVHVDDYVLPLNDHTYAITIGIRSPNAGDSAVFFELARGKDEIGISHFNWIIYNEYGPNEDDEESWPQNADDSGSMKLVWNEDGINHKFKAYYQEAGAADWTMLTEGDGFDIDNWGWDGTPESDRILRLSLGGYDEGTGEALTDGSMMYADNFVLVPEPMTLSLLAIGGLAALIRRKR